MAKRKKLKKILIVFLSLIVVALGAFGIMEILKPKPYSISGTVLVDGVPVEGVTVYSTSATTITDAEGKYKIGGIYGEITVSLSNEDYYFETASITTNCSGVCDFSGISYREVFGQVVSGENVVANAKLTIQAENGEFITYSDSEGNFYLNKLAGKVSISATKDEMKFFSTTLEKGETDVVVNGTTSATISLNFDYNAENDISIKLDGNQIDYDKSDEFVVNDIKKDSIIEILSDNYYIKNNKFILSEENGKFTVDCFAKYNINGRAISGSEVIANADVYVGEEKITETDNDGHFTIDDLYGVNAVCVKKAGFTVYNTETSFEKSDVNAVLLYNISGTVICDQAPIEDVLVCIGDISVCTDKNGRFSASVYLGDNIVFSKNGYYFEKAYAVEIDNSKFNVIAQEYYYIDFCVTNNGVKIPFELTIDGEKINVEENFRLHTYSSHVIEINCEGYELESYETNIDKNNNFSECKAKRVYEVNATVRSGDIMLSGVVSYLDKSVEFENGSLYIDKIYENTLIKIDCAGYDSFQSIINDSNDIDVNLSYDLILTAKSGNSSVDDYIAVFNGEELHVVEELTLSGLYGNTEITLKKDNYVFETFTTSKGGNYIVNATYKIFGVANKDGEMLEGIKIILIDSEGKAIQSVYTDSNGGYSFESLSGSYVLFSENSNNVSLKPEYYDIDCGGEYNFSNNGYNIEGCVKIGETPLKNVKITAGDKIVYTDDNGYYLFSLLSSDCVLTFAKQGYVFNKNNITIYEKDGDVVIDVVATYEVSGQVLSGGVPVSQVLVSCGEYQVYTDDYGKFVISGITNEQALITFAKDGYEISDVVVDGYTKLLIDAYVKVDFSFISGDLPIEDVVINSSNINGFVCGEVVTFTKDGYTFDSYTITAPETVVISAKYKVAGYVTSGSLLLSGVKVSIDSIETETDKDGKFEILGIEGKKTLTFTKDGYQISSIEVGGPSEIKAIATYSVNVKVKCGVYDVDNVCLKIGDIVVYTDAMGEATLNGLYGEMTITATKDGYNFSGDFEVAGPKTINLKSSYTVKGIITTAGNALSGINVTLGSRTAVSDDNGAFEFDSIEGFFMLTISQSGYSEYVREINSPEQLDITLGYKVKITFSGINSYDGISVLNNGEVIQTINEQEVVLGFFNEEVKLSFEKENVKFTPNLLTVSKYGEYQINCVKSYKISGTVLTESGLAVRNMKISAGKYSTYTDKDGKYEIKGLEGKVQINGSFEGITHNSKLTPKTTEEEGVFNFTISDMAYGWALYENGYRFLNLASSYEIYGSGNVNPSVGGGQKVKSVNKKDTKGNILLENLNYGGEVAGVDPKVGLATFYNNVDGSVKYKKVTGGSVSSSLVADYSGANWTDTTVNGYMTVFGVNVKTVLPYTINDNTLSSVSVALLDDGGYSMTMNLSSSSETWSNYAMQMTQLSGQTPKSFSYINLYFTFNDKGYITKLNIKEKYTVNVVIDVNITGDLNYEYIMPSLDYRINDLLIDTETNLQNSLKKGE
ncbi:MAG: hypothetical protein E7353_02545 [Clostridiales bacterium]|nr:hypothetical protein [Clostridiales bacterium]